MGKVIPSGYLSIDEALNRLGRELFPAEWTGEEHKARRGLISEHDWLRIKDLPPPRGTDAPGGGRGGGGAFARPVTAKVPSPPDDPSGPAYQAEYKASERYASARGRLHVSLERGDLEAAILDPFTGTLHRTSASLWRRHDADRMIERGQAPIPGSRNTGSVLVKRFAEPNVDTKPIPQAKIQEAIEALKKKIATESLTRPQQGDFLRKNFPSYRITERQLNEIFRVVPVSKGRRRKSDKKSDKIVLRENCSIFYWTATSSISLGQSIFPREAI